MIDINCCTMAARGLFDCGSSSSTSSSLNSAPFDDFEKLVSEVDGKEIASEVYAEMASTTGVEPDIDKLAKDRKVAAQLEQLKRRSNQK